MGLLDSFFFSSIILVRSHFTVKVDLESIFLSVCETSLSFPSVFSIFIHQPVEIVGLAAVVAHVPDCFLGQTSRSRAWGKKGKNVESRGREERERGSCSTTEPLQLFKWPLSLCTCSLCLVWILKWLPPKRQISRRWSPRREQRAESTWLLAPPVQPPHCHSWRTGDYLCDWQRDFERWRYSCHVWPKFHERQAEGLR